MKIQTLKKTLFSLAIALTFASCQTDDNLETSKVIITDFKATELVKMHGGSEKSWKLTNVILPQGQINSPTVLNNDCVSDDVYTFKASATNTSVENLKIDLGNNRCFKTNSDAESFEGKLLYVPYKLNGEIVIETTLVLKYTRIKNIGGETSTVSNIDSYRLSELTEDRMVFSTGAEYVGEYSFAYVFERI